jgi:alpha-glucosidase
MPDLGERSGRPVDDGEEDHPFWDRDTVHEVYREWRRVADSYPDPKMFVAEAWVPTPDRLARYVRPDHLHSAFNFDFLTTPWRAALLRASIDEALLALAAVSAEPTWVLSNHDVVRVVSRLGLPQPIERSWELEVDDMAEPDLDLGTRRARAAALLMLALPGAAYVYQGEELGLWEVLDLPDEVLADPIWERSGHARRGRDGARVPLPWAADGQSFGFGPDDGARPWLPQPAAWAEMSVERQAGNPASMLELYRSALRIRRKHRGLGSGPMRWRDAPKGVLSIERDDGFLLVVNVEGAAFELPSHREALLASGPLDGSRLPPDTAIWLQM